MKPDNFMVGIGKVDITPNYNSPTRRWHLPDENARIKTFHSPLYAKTIAFSDGDKIVTLTSMDVAIQYKTHHDLIRKTVREMTSVPIDEIILHSTHQHSDSFMEYEPAYDIFGINDSAFDMDYINSIPKKVATSIILALQNLRSAVVGYKSGAIEEGIASCRRITDNEGNLTWRDSRPSEALRALPRGHIDPEVGVVTFSEPNGSSIATLINYACHPSVAGGDSPNCISADYPGFATEMIDSVYGGMSVFLHGCTGDINPAKYVRGNGTAVEDRIADARRMGQILAGEVLKTLALIETEEINYFKSAQKETVLPVQSIADGEEKCLQNAREAIMQWREKGNNDPRTAIRKYIIARKIKNGDCPVNMSAVAINNLAIAFIPGEPFTEYGETIKRNSKADMTLVAATCGEDPFYIPTPEAIAQGGYESSYIANDETGGSLINQADELLKEIKQ